MDHQYSIFSLISDTLSGTELKKWDRTRPKTVCIIIFWEKKMDGTWAQKLSGCVAALIILLSEYQKVISFSTLGLGRDAQAKSFYKSRVVSSFYETSICTWFLEISILRNWFLNLILSLFGTWFLQTTEAVKIKFEIDQKSSSKINFGKYRVQKIG